MTIPEGHSAIMPYLILKNAEGFIDFTQAVFGAQLTYKGIREGTDIIQHAQIIINGGTIMFTEASDKFGETNAQLFVYVENADDTYHKALANGATSMSELSNQDYGRTGGIKDPFGIVWWVTSL